MENQKWIHAPAAYGFCGKEMTVHLALPDDGAAVPKLELSYQVLGENSKKEGSVRMHPTDGFCAKECYSIFSGTVPAEATKAGETLVYRFVAEGEKSEKYSVQLLDLPRLPELTVTEISCWGWPYCKYLELANLTDRALDLYDYELLKLEDSGVFGRNPLAPAKGKHIIPAHGIAAVRFLDPDFYTAGLSPEREVALEKMAFYHPTTCADIAERDILLFDVVTAELKPNGKYGFIGECFNLYGKYTPRTLYLAPRGGSVEDGFMAMELSRCPERRDVRCCHSQLWYFDPRDPKTGIIQSNFAELTPGFLDQTQAALNMTEYAVPAVLPLEPGARVHLADGDVSLQFAVIGGGNAYRATVYVKEGEDFVPHTALLNNDGVYEYVIPAVVVGKMQMLQYYIEVAGGLYTATVGTAEEPVTVAVIDNAGPALCAIYPADLQVLENDFTPEIKISYYDISGISQRICILCLDGLNVSADATWSENGVTYTPTRKLAYGEHTIELTLRDTLGNRSYYTSTFTVGDGKELNLYCGQVHSHTADSDGKGTPEEAIAHARYKNGMDYFAVTDHTHYIEHADYVRQVALANKENDPGKFALLYGFEMTWNDGNGYYGHTNVLNTDWITLYPIRTTMYEFYKKLVTDENAVAMFNHPDASWGNANEFEWCGEEVASKYFLSEINGKHYDPYYALSLSKGWRTGPVYNEDNHRKTWGDSGCMGYVLAPALTRENILDAMRRRRTYSTTDRTMKVYYRVNGEWLGSVLQNPQKLTVEADISTEREEGIGRIELVTEDNIVVAAIEAGARRDFSWQVEIDPDFDYYYLRITNGNVYTVTAPVFIEGRDLLNIKQMKYGVSDDVENPHVVTATVKNDGEKPLTDVTVDLYMSYYDAFRLRERMPHESVHIGKLNPGESRTVSRRFPEIPKNHRISAVVSGMAGKQRYADTSYVHVAPFTITKVMAQTSPIEKDGVTVKNPYPYIEIYNHTARPVCLDKYTVRMWATIGHEPAPEHVLPLDGLQIAPDSTLVIWMRPEGAALTAEDFNAHYGTKLLEGEDLFITSVAILQADKLGHRLDLWREREIVSRVHYGYFCTHDLDVVPDVPLCYTYKPHMTVQQPHIKRKEGGEIPAPGKVLAEQRQKPLKGLCRHRESVEAERSATRQKVITRLTKASLVPFRAAALVANAVSALKGFFDTKE